MVPVTKFITTTKIADIREDVGNFIVRMALTYFFFLAFGFVA